MEKMRDGAILANSGHFDVEINLKALEEMSTKITRVRDFLDEYALEDGRHLYVAGEGRLVNLAAAEGHPSAVMDMSFANQAMAAEYLLKHSDEMSGNVYDMPEALDREIAALKLKAMEVEIDNAYAGTGNLLERVDLWDGGIETTLAAKEAAVRRIENEQHLYDRSFSSFYQ